jgi:ubiquinone/menaquinone biosynthesis C-methylase UbiE
MRDYERRIKMKFKWLAAFYDLFDLVFLLDKKENPRQALARKVPNETLRILDVCIGTANSAIAVAEANDQVEIVGIDLSPDMMAVAEGKIQKRGIANISFRQMNAGKMDFQDGEFDIVMISFALHEMEYESIMRILREMRRVLREAGMLYIVDYEVEGSAMKNFIFSIYLKLFEPRHMPQFLGYDWTKMLEEIGFRVTDIEEHFFSKLISAHRQPGVTAVG